MNRLIRFVFGLALVALVPLAAEAGFTKVQTIDGGGRKTLADKTIYPGDRIVCPGVFPKERREEDAGKEWLDIIHKDSFDGGHIVLDVPKGGKDYSITYLTAADESMKVLSVMNFRS